MKMLQVTWARPEIERSNPGQDEVKPSFIEVCRVAACMRSYDLGLGVKSQSSSVIAGSYRS